jgi:putative oxidoreductase
MNLQSLLSSIETMIMRLVPGWLASLALRFGLAVPFYKSGLTKWEGFGQFSDSAVTLFEEEFKLHILGRVYDYPYPNILAHASAIAEICLPILLVLGLFTRFAALGLLVMTGIIQLTVPDGWPLHITWAAMAAGLVALGGGRLSLDRLWRRAA